MINDACKIDRGFLFWSILVIPHTVLPASLMPLFSPSIPHFFILTKVIFHILKKKFCFRQRRLYTKGSNILGLIKPFTCLTILQLY